MVESGCEKRAMNLQLEAESFVRDIEADAVSVWASCRCDCYLCVLNFGNGLTMLLDAWTYDDEVVMRVIRLISGPMCLLLSVLMALIARVKYRRGRRLKYLARDMRIAFEADTLRVKEFYADQVEAHFDRLAKL